MATMQALTVFLQNRSACVECLFLRHHRCSDRWFHELTGVCHGCDVARDLKEEHYSDCPARDDRMLAQACNMLHATARYKRVAPHEVACLSTRMTNPLKTLPRDVVANVRSFASDRLQPHPIAVLIKTLSFIHRMPSGCQRTSSIFAYPEGVPGEPVPPYRTRDDYGIVASMLRRDVRELLVAGFVVKGDALRNRRWPRR